MGDRVIGTLNAKVTEGVARGAFGQRYAVPFANRIGYAASVAVGAKAQLISTPCYLDGIYVAGGTDTLGNLYDDADNTSLENPILTLDLSNLPFSGTGGALGLTSGAYIPLGIELANGLIFDAADAPSLSGGTVQGVYARYSVGPRVYGSTPFSKQPAARDGDLDCMGGLVLPVQGRQWYNVVGDANSTTSIQIETAPVFLSHVIFGYDYGTPALSIYDHASADSNRIVQLNPIGAGPNAVLPLGVPMENGLRIKWAAGAQPSTLIVYHKYA